MIKKRVSNFGHPTLFLFTPHLIMAHILNLSSIGMMRKKEKNKRYSLIFNLTPLKNLYICMFTK